METTSGTYRRIFVLGSGFSKSFCPQMPTLRDLNERIPFGIPDEFPHLRDYCREFLKLCNNQPDYLNIETLSTSILSAQIFPGVRESLYHSSLRFELLRFIANEIRHDKGMDADSAAVLRKFLAGCENCPSEGVRDTLLLSFNYDTLIEDVITADPELAARVAVDYGVRIDPADRRTAQTICLFEHDSGDKGGAAIGIVEIIDKITMTTKYKFIPSKNKNTNQYGWFEIVNHLWSGDSHFSPWSPA